MNTHQPALAEQYPGLDPEFEFYGEGPLPHPSENPSRDITRWLFGAWAYVRDGTGEKDGKPYAIRRGTELHRLNFPATQLPADLPAPPELEGHRWEYRGIEYITNKSCKVSTLNTRESGQWSNIFECRSTAHYRETVHLVEYIPNAHETDFVTIPTPDAPAQQQATPREWVMWNKGIVIHPLNDCVSDKERKSLGWKQITVREVLTPASDAELLASTNESQISKTGPFRVQAGKRYVRRDGQITSSLVKQDGKFWFLDPESGETVHENANWFSQDQAYTYDGDLICEYVPSLITATLTLVSP